MSEFLKKYGTSDEILKYILEDLSSDPDFATAHIHEKLWRKLGDSIKRQLEPGEEVLYYVDDAIIMHGKSGYAITNRRTFFSDNKWETYVYHSRISQLRISVGDLVHVYLNKNTDVRLTPLGANNYLALRQH